MPYAPDQHGRRSIRLPAYDYAQAGAYFVTIVCKDRECRFGDLIDGGVILNEPGRMVEAVWRGLPQHYPGVGVDAFVVMPNHVHGIIVLAGAGAGQPQVGAGPRACPSDAGQPQGVAPTRTMLLPDVVHRFKSLTTARYRRGVLEDRWCPFPGRLWQRNYYEHVVRSEEELDDIREYIAGNPLRWADDRENPANADEPNVGALGCAPLRDV